MILKGKMLLAAVMMLGALGLLGCAPTVRLESWKIQLPDELRDCDAAKLPRPLPAGASVEAMDMESKIYSIDQAAAFKVCKNKGLAKTAIIDAHNKQVKDLHRPWWQFWK